MGIDIRDNEDIAASGENICLYPTASIVRLVGPIVSIDEIYPTLRRELILVNDTGSTILLNNKRESLPKYQIMTGTGFPLGFEHGTALKISFNFCFHCWLASRLCFDSSKRSYLSFQTRDPTNIERHTFMAHEKQLGDIL